MKKILPVILTLLLLCAGAAAEGETARISACPVLNHAFTVLEKGNPFTE